MTDSPKPADSVATAQTLYELDQAMSDLELLCLNLLTEVATMRSRLQRIDDPQPPGVYPLAHVPKGSKFPDGTPDYHGAQHADCDPKLCDVAEALNRR